MGLGSEISAISDEGWVFLYEHVPHWYAKLLGPIPPEGDERLTMQMDYMVFPDRASVEENIWAHVQVACESMKWEFDPDQWELIQLTAINAN